MEVYTISDGELWIGDQSFYQANKNWFNANCNANHHLYQHYEMYTFLVNDLWMKTNCELTALMLRDKLVPGEWELANNPDSSANCYQVSIGSKPSDIEHIFTVLDNKLVHSWFNTFEPMMQELEAQEVVDLKSGNSEKIASVLAASLKQLSSYKILLDVIADSNVYYWVPKMA